MNMNSKNTPQPQPPWIDLSQLIDQAMPVYPGDPRVRLRRLATHEQNGYQLTELSMSCHSGTHLDAPRHYLPEGPSIDQLAPEQLILTAWVTRIDPDSHGLLDVGTIDWSGWRPGDGLLLAVSPSTPIKNGLTRFTQNANAVLLQRRLPLIGANIATFEEADDVLGQGGLHVRLLQAGTLLLENLTQLEPLIGQRVDLIALPLRIAGADGAPARVFARVITCNPASDDI